MSSILTADSLGMRETGTACPHVYAVLAVVIPIVALMLPTCASLRPDSWPAIGILMLCHKVHLLLLQPLQHEQLLEQMYAALRAVTHCCCCS